MKRVELKIYLDVDTTGSIDEEKFTSAIDKCISDSFIKSICKVARIDYIDEIEV